MKAGIGHLQDKLETFREEINGKTFIISDETVSDALHECDLCFTLLLKRAKAIEDDQRRQQLQDMFVSPLKGGGGGHNGINISTSKGPVFSTSLEFLNELDNENVSNLNTLRPYNQRIDLNANEDNLLNVPASGTFVMLDGTTIGTNGMMMDDTGPDIDDDELTRDKVKRASTQILAAMDKKKKKLTKNKSGKERGSGGGGGGSNGHHGNVHEDEQSTTSAKR